MPRPHTNGLKLNVEHRDQGVLVRMKGSANMNVSDELQERLYQLVDEGTKRVVLDMAELDFICSAGLGGLIAAQLHAQKVDSELRLANPQPQIRELLNLTKLTSLFTVYDSIDEALVAG
jgi:anti-sigma B factor antagonist